MRNLYEDLGVSRTAGLGDIRDAYRKLALELHPDRNPGDRAKEERFKEITHAYSILCDERQRARYDHELNRPQPRPAPAPAYEPPPYDPFEPAQEKYRATKASFFYQYGKRKRERQQQGFWGPDPFGPRPEPFTPEAPAVFYTTEDPFEGPASFTISAPIEMGTPIPIVNGFAPRPGQQVPLMQHPQYGQIPVYFQFRRGV